MPSGVLRRTWHRLVSGEDETVADHVGHEAHAGATTSIDASPLRRPVRLQGTLRVVTVNPIGSHRWLEAELDDGTGEVTLVWMGRRTVPGIDAGRNVRVEGVITLAQGGRKVVYNPRYDLLGT